MFWKFFKFFISVAIAVFFVTFSPFFANYYAKTPADLNNAKFGLPIPWLYQDVGQVLTPPEDWSGYVRANPWEYPTKKVDSKAYNAGIAIVFIVVFSFLILNGKVIAILLIFI